MEMLQNLSVQLLSHARLFETPWTAARQASLSITNSGDGQQPTPTGSLLLLLLLSRFSRVRLCATP